LSLVITAENYDSSGIRLAEGADRCIRRVRDKLPFEDRRTHDFRRSLSTGVSGWCNTTRSRKDAWSRAGWVLTVYNKQIG